MVSDTIRRAGGGSAADGLVLLGWRCDADGQAGDRGCAEGDGVGRRLIAPVEAVPEALQERPVGNGVGRAGAAADQLVDGGADHAGADGRFDLRSEEHTSELQSLMRISYAVFCLKKTNSRTTYTHADRQAI